MAFEGSALFSLQENTNVIDNIDNPKNNLELILFFII
ncbi:Maf-like protein [Flavobacteriales bacterium ALC-1]|nr:Maf-like protein [Flavobacteriales bacterium ALC-1]